MYISPHFKRYFAEAPLTLIDVGAYGGLQPNWQPLKSILKVIGFEPEKKRFGSLEENKNQNEVFFNIALHKRKDKVDFNIMRKGAVTFFETNTSFWNQFPESERAEIVGKQSVEVDTIDNQFESSPICDADFMKVDTEGGELFILEGSQKILQSNLLGIELEVCFAELFLNAPLFAEVDTFVRKFGFDLWDLQRRYWQRKISKNRRGKKGQLIFGNVVYLKNMDSLRLILEKMDTIEAKRAKLLKMMLISRLYGFEDYALHLANHFRMIFDEREQKILLNPLNKRRVFHFRVIPGGMKLVSAVDKLKDYLLTLVGHEWAWGDAKLGNKKFC